MSVVCRFAPSPTGNLHVGGARTAIYNWLFARANGGKFHIRIEDTDTERSTKEYEESILRDLSWLGLDYDGDLVYQCDKNNVETLQKYWDKAHFLMQCGWAYKCYCSTEFLQKKREEMGKDYKYNPSWARIHDSEESFTIRFSLPAFIDGVEVDDAVRGKIFYSAKDIEDFIIIKRNGVPTYNFATVVDDILLGTTHVIRGDDHLVNTPKQILIYHAIGAKPPKYVHLPMILGEDKKRLSKRHGATAVSEFKDKGILSDALFNYLVRLGWSDGDNEIFSKTELLEKFSLENIGKSGAMFDEKKLLWLNGVYINNFDGMKLTNFVADEFGFKNDYMKFMKYLRLINVYKSRVKTIKEFFSEDLNYLHYYEWDSNLDKGHYADNLEFYRDFLDRTLDRLSRSFWTAENVETFVQSVLGAMNKTNKDVANLRVILAGRKHSPSLSQIIYILGSKVSKYRFNSFVESIRHDNSIDLEVSFS